MSLRLKVGYSIWKSAVVSSSLPVYYTLLDGASSYEAYAGSVTTLLITRPSDGDELSDFQTTFVVSGTAVGAEAEALTLIALAADSVRTFPVTVSGTFPVSISTGSMLTVSGSVNLTEPAVVVQGTSPWLISSSLWIPTVTGSVELSSPVAVSNFPLGQNVNITGSVTLVTSVSNFPSVQTVTGSVSLSGPVTGTFVIGAPITGSVNLTEPITGTFKLSEAPIAFIRGTSGTLLDVDGNGKLMLSADGQAGFTSPARVVQVGGLEVSTGFLRAFNVDSLGRLVTAPVGSTNVNGFAFGDVTTAVTTQAVVRKTVYVEQTASAVRSLVSSAAADATGSTGAMKVKITFLDVTGSGPFTEIVTMNGTVPVNTVSPDICFVEKMEVVQVGSAQASVGTISLRQSTAGFGSTIGSIAAGDNQAYWAHHYTPNGKTTYITSFASSHNGTTVGSGGRFQIKSISIANDGTAGKVERQVSDYLRQYGQAGSIQRNFGTAIPIVGPARSTVYVNPESSTTITYRGSFDFYDQ